MSDGARTTWPLAASEREDDLAARRPHERRRRIVCEHRLAVDVRHLVADVEAWLRRRRECGRPCQTCASECPSQAIRPTGEINAGECHHCLDCQVTFWNAYRCPPLVERRKRFERRGQKLRLTL